MQGGALAASLAAQNRFTNSEITSTGVIIRGGRVALNNTLNWFRKSREIIKILSAHVIMTFPYDDKCLSCEYSKRFLNIYYKYLLHRRSETPSVMAAEYHLASSFSQPLIAVVVDQGLAHSTS